MSDHLYRIIYEGKADQAIREIDKIIAAHTRLQASADKTIAKLKAVGADSSGLTKFVGDVTKLDALLKALVGDANKAEKELKDVGKGNNSLTGYATRVDKVAVSLNAATTAGNRAKASLSGVGAGGPGKGVSGRGGVGASSGLGSMAAGASLGSMFAAIHSVGEGAQKGRDYFKSSADMTKEYRNKLTDLANLQGKIDPDDDLIRQDLAFQKKTLLGPDDSRTFRTEFGGAIAPALDARGPDGTPNITPEVAKGLEVEAGKFTARYGLDPTTGGRLSGLLGKTQKVPTAKAGLKTIAETMEQLNIKGVGLVRQLAPQLLSLSGGMLEQVNDDSEEGEAGGGGRFKSYPEMAARFAATTASQAGSGARAKTRIVQSDRLLRKLAYDRDSDLGKKAQITPEDDYETAIRKLAPHIHGSQGDHTLKEAGYRNSTERLAVIEAAKNNAIMDANMAQARKSKALLDPVADNEAYARSLIGQQKAGDARDFAIDIEAGLKVEKLEIGRKAALGRLKDPNQPGGQRINTPATSLTDFGRKVASIGFVNPEEERVDMEAVEGLTRGGRAVGLDIPARFPGLLKTGLARDAGSDVERREQYGQAYDLIQSRGGDPLGGGPQKAATALRAAANALDTMGQQQRPAPAPPGNGGGGVVPGRR